jgi:hypothetical protein
VASFVSKISFAALLQLERATFQGQEMFEQFPVMWDFAQQVGLQDAWKHGIHAGVQLEDSTIRRTVSVAI